TEPEPEPKKRWSSGSSGYVQSSWRRWRWGRQWWHGRVGAGAPQVSYGPVEGCVSSQDRRAEEHTKASESAMAVMV
ncbi:MAG: hypothetical protein ACK56F_05640, partial [bacterium]